MAIEIEWIARRSTLGGSNYVAEVGLRSPGLGLIFRILKSPEGSADPYYALPDSVLGNNGVWCRRFEASEAMRKKVCAEFIRRSTPSTDASGVDASDIDFTVGYGRHKDEAC